MDEQPQEIMQPVVAKKFPTILIVLICVLVSGAVFGAAGYFGANMMLVGEKTPLLNQIKTLTTEKADLQTKLDEVAKALSAQTAQPITPVEPTLRVVYEPAGIFTAEDKQLLNEKVVTTYVDYYSAEIGVNDPVQIVIIKKTPVKSGLAMFNFQVVHKTAFATFSLSQEKGKTDYTPWQPACMFTDCRDVPQKFAEKYPDLIAKIKGLNLTTNTVVPTPAPAPTPAPTPTPAK